MSVPVAAPAHRWKFTRAGATEQVVIRNGGDIVHLDQLDQKLWVALACPARGLDFDPRTLDLIDTDGDGRIRPPELIEAGHWVRDRFADPGELFRGGDTVPLASINRTTESGRQLASDAEEMLALLGKAGADCIGLDDVSDRGRLFAAMRFNGDGVVAPGDADDEVLAQLLRLIVERDGGVADRNGEMGVDAARVRDFFADAEALDGWRRSGEADIACWPLGEDTPAAAGAMEAVRGKVDDYFARCALAAFDASAVASLNPLADDYRALASAALHKHAPAISALPLARIEPSRPLPLDSGVNPAWADALADFRGAAEALLGRPLAELHEAEWRSIESRLGACRDWLAAKPPTKLAGVDAGELRRLLADDSRERVTALIAMDVEREAMNQRIVDLEKMIRLQRDLVRLLDNFVSFADFYDRRGGIFEAGTLYLDGRSCDLTVQVFDIAQHVVLAGLARTYLAYCQCSRDGEKQTIVAAFTAGDVDFLMVGRNGVFYDREGRDWDATIVRVIENPVSIRQAFLMPYKKVLRAIEEQLAKRAAAGDAKASDRLVGTAMQFGGRAPGTPATAAAAAAPQVAALRQGRFDVGTIAALGVALGSISTVLVAVFAKFVDLGWWIPVALAGIVLAISGPSMAVAWLKLRQRSLGPILDASGWAINGRMRINVPLGASLSKTARLPAHAERGLRDPFAESHVTAWSLLLVVVSVAAMLAAWRLGLLDAWLPLSWQCLPAAPTR